MTEYRWEARARLDGMTESRVAGGSLHLVTVCLSDDGAGDGGFGDAEGKVAGVGGDAEGEFGAGFDDDGEWAGPELFREAVEGGVELTGDLVGLGDLGDEKREWLVARAGFEVVDSIDGF